MSTLESQNDISNQKVLTGMFYDRVSSENAFNELYEKGYAHEDINLFMSEDTRKKYFSDEHTDIGTKAAEGLGAGSIIGGGIGGLAGIVAALGTSILIPGLGILIAGPLAVGIAAAGIGGITGGLIGTLIGAGIPEENAHQYENEIKKGNILMCVHSKNNEDEVYFNSKWSDHYSSK